MRQRIENNLTIICDDVDLTTISNIEFYISQGKLFFKYVPTVMSKDKMIVKVPYSDAMKLEKTSARLQFAFLHENGTPDASNTVTCEVDELLKRTGYDPV